MTTASLEGWISVGSQEEPEGEEEAEEEGKEGRDKRIA